MIDGKVVSVLSTGGQSLDFSKILCELFKSDFDFLSRLVVLVVLSDETEEFYISCVG
jgi:hypothetical protein